MENDKEIDKAKIGKSEKKPFLKKAVAPLLLIVLVGLYYYLPYKEKKDFVRSTAPDFESVVNTDLDEGDLEKLRGEYDQIESDLSKNGYNLEANLKKAEILRVMEEYDKAFAIYTKMTEIYPEDSRAFKGIGDIYFTRREYVASEAPYLQAIKLDAKNTEAYTQLARAYRYFEKDNGKISKFYEDGIKALGDDKDALVNLYAKHLERIGEYGKAAEQWKILLEKMPDDVDIQNTIAELEAKMNSGSAAPAAEATTAAPEAPAA
jgi:tetratricopeptide (TPR) repeat protein